MTNLRIGRVKGHTFLPALLQHGRVIDLGMNRGDFAQHMRTMHQCTVSGVEANPQLALTTGQLGDIVCINAAIAAADGVVQFAVDETNSEASTIVDKTTAQTLNTVAVPSISLTSLMQQLGVSNVDLLKIDVEGAELDVIETTARDVFKRCKQITIEFHLFLYEGEARLQMEHRINAAINRLTQMGFYCIDFTTNRSDVLFLNTSMIPLSGADRLDLHRQKYQAGLVRKLYHMVGRRHVNE